MYGVVTSDVDSLQNNVIAKPNIIIVVIYKRLEKICYYRTTFQYKPPLIIFINNIGLSSYFL